MITGCNVENASYGLTLCAECGLVSALHAAGGGTLVAVSVVAADGAPLLPCGRCRQLLLEAGGPGLLVDTDAGPTGSGACCRRRSPRLTWPPRERRRWLTGGPAAAGRAATPRWT